MYYIKVLFVFILSLFLNVCCFSCISDELYLKFKGVHGEKDQNKCMYVIMIFAITEQH